MTVHHDGLTVDWLGYATTRIEAPTGTVVYTDPGRYGVLTGEWAPSTPTLGDHPRGPAFSARDGDVVVITHDHHYDDDGVRRVAAPDARVVVYEAVSAHRIAERSGRDVAAPEQLPYDTRRVGYGDEVSFTDVTVRAVPAYNRSAGPRAGADGTVTHPPGFGCGFVLTIAGIPCFWTGDSDVIDDHADLDVSLFIPSIAERLTMGPAGAADLAERVAPDLVLPIHYNTFERLAADSRAFAADVASRSIPVVLDEGKWDSSSVG